VTSDDRSAHAARARCFLQLATVSLQQGAADPLAVGEARNWVAVQYFYAAVHAVESHLQQWQDWRDRGPDRRSARERRRFADERLWPGRSDFRHHFRFLESMAEQARYDARYVASVADVGRAAHAAGQLVGRFAAGSGGATQP